MMHAALDDTPPEMLIWMPAHTGKGDVGRARLSNGALLTDIDRDMNENSDRLAKAAILAHRVPKQVRDSIRAREESVGHLAKWIGQANFLANHRVGVPKRDSTACRKAARKRADDSSMARL